MNTEDKAPEKAPKRHHARKSCPVVYSQSAVAAVCKLIGEGESLRAVSKMEGMPHFTTFLQWVTTHPGVQAQYTEALEMRAQYHADLVIELSDETPEYVTTTDENGSTTTRIDPAWVNRQRLRIDARKWIAAKLYPRKYGERVEVTGAGGKPIEYRDVTQLSDEQITARLTELGSRGRGIEAAAGTAGQAPEPSKLN